MFKIDKIKKSKLKSSLYGGNKYFKIDVFFSLSEEASETDENRFGVLGKYSKSVAVSDIKSYEDYYGNIKNYEYDLVAHENKNLKTMLKTMVYRKASAYDLGICKIVDTIGEDVIRKRKDGTFSYSSYVSSNYITNATVKQLEEMKLHIDSGICRYGNYPQQNGAFNTGSAFDDFLGIVATLNRFWD